MHSHPECAGGAGWPASASQTSTTLQRSSPFIIWRLRQAAGTLSPTGKGSFRPLAGRTHTHGHLQSTIVPSKPPASNGMINLKRLAMGVPHNSYDCQQVGLLQSSDSVHSCGLKPLRICELFCSFMAMRHGSMQDIRCQVVDAVRYVLHCSVPSCTQKQVRNASCPISPKRQFAFSIQGVSDMMLLPIPMVWHGCICM